MVPGSALRPARPQTSQDAALVRCRVTSHGLSLRLERGGGVSAGLLHFPAGSAVGWPAQVADEIEQCLVDLVGVGPDDRMRPTCDDGGAGVLQQRGKPPAGGLVRQYAILVAVDDQDGNLDSCEVGVEVFPAGGDAA